ncbi:MAG: ParB/RepB/Spo0J family partition protein [Clostridiales Family XIII bacterium]|jgi:ParB family chromosome partitioning protein|nr:ParB/RepB/Spo0J family partition protein [Clostridiales Family XIII bacterium]
MADKSGQTFALPKKSNMLDELFTTQEQRDDLKREKVTDIPLSEIDPFPDHPFRVKQDESMTAMAESVKAVGIQSPAIVRRKESGRYELVSGHRRKMACEIAGLDSLPCIVRELTRDEAIIAMVDANLQREVILPSEKAKSYKMRYEAMKRQAGRPSKENLSPVGTNLRSDEELAQMSGDSRNQIHRFIRLTELIPEVLTLVDEGKIAMRPAVELSYLPTEAQESLLEAIESEDCTPNHAQAIKMRKFAEEGRLGEDVILSIMQEEKPNQAEQFKIPRERISKFFAPGTPAERIQEIIVKALEYYKQREFHRGERQRDAAR